jgi:hypothetical protein
MPKTPHQIAFDLREQARAWCPEALAVVTKCLKSQDEKVRLAAAAILFERSYGKAPVTAIVSTEHKFVVAPPRMSRQEWIETRGQGYGAPLVPPANLCPDAPNRTNDTVLDLKVESSDKPDKLN